MNEFDEPIRRTRSKKKLLRVTFPDSTSICYANVTMTFMETLRQIGLDSLKTITLEVGHTPLISNILYPKYKGYQKELFRGWYVNIQSDSEQKFLQLKAINAQLNLNLKLELGEDFETDKARGFSKKKKPKGDLLVKFTDGQYIAGEHPIDTYKDTIQQFGIDKIARKSLDVGGKIIVSNIQVTKSYVEIEPNRWLFIPTTTKEKAKFLMTIGLLMKMPIEVTVID